ncbi:MAG: YciI family protein [Chloroflexota bacterium]
MRQAYIYTIRPRRAGFGDSMTEREEAIMDEHFRRLKGMLQEGTLLIAGPCEDAAFGIVVFYAESDQEAEAVMAADPAVREGLMDAEVHRFVVSLLARSTPQE